MIDLSKGLDPSSSLGLVLIFFGILFSIGCIYVMSNLTNDSIFDQRRKEAMEKEREEKIARLYPKKSIKQLR
tara:strand:- start:1789 stop:2004 length:216 start_codon:yes stop_codon:yes gene_type:complete